MKHGLELVFRPEVQAILDHFCGLLNVRIAFFSSDGEELRVGQDRPICTYCKALRHQLGYDVLCRTLDASVRQEVAKTGRLKAYTCHGGMIEAVMPVLISGRPLGFIMIGQFRDRQVPPANVLRKASPRDRVKLRRSFAQAPHLTVDQVKHALGMFELIVRHVSEKRLVNVEDALQLILNRLRESPESHLSLKQAASLVGRSPGALSRLFRKTCGQGYQQMRVQLLLDKADTFFREQPGIQVQEVAYRLGFEDPLYFSRLYRRNRGERARDAARRLGR